MSRNGVHKVLMTAVLILAVILFSCVWSGARPKDSRPVTGFIQNQEEVISSIRLGLREHSSKITIRFSYGADVLAQLPELADGWVELALEETDDPTEGDYLRYQYGGYQLNSAYEAEAGVYRYTVELTPRYYCFLSEEQRAGEAAEALLESFRFTGETSDYQKAAEIYDYLCREVKYDRIHLKNPYYHRRSTAYAALVQGTATCQGYAVAFYRLARMAGLNCRVVIGTVRGEEGLHAWNIVEVDGAWYCADATWDAGQEGYRWFLSGAEKFTDHTPNERFTGDFSMSYPLSKTDYPRE